MLKTLRPETVNLARHHNLLLCSPSLNTQFQNRPLDGQLCWSLIKWRFFTHLHTGHRQEPLSQLSCKYDSRSKHWMCLHSWPRAGNVIRLNVIGHFRETFKAVCSTASRSLSKFEDAPVLLKFRLIFATQWSAVRRRFRKRPCNTDRTLGLCTSCRTNRCD